jgi:hypothetical protein
MKRLHLIEIEDQNWCPNGVRDAVTDFLQLIMRTAKPYAAMVPLLSEALRRAGTSEVLDLGSGGAGPWRWLQPELAGMGLRVTVCLTDKYPNLAAFGASSRSSNEAIFCHPHSVDAARVPAALAGFRTLFTAFHHFRPAEARAVLADAVKRRQGIGIFEVTNRRLLPLFFVLLSPVLMLLLTPFIRPFRWSRLLWTYVVPLAPLVLVFDGLVSLMRTYNPRQLEEFAQGLDADHYEWKIGRARNGRFQIPVTYLIGVPTDPEK